MADRIGPWAVIAGASEGLGAAFATELATRGIHLVLIARRKEPLQRLAVELEAKHGIQTLPLALDLASDGAAATIAAQTASLDIGLLIFNAASGHIAEFTDTPLQALESIVALNCGGLVRVVHCLVPRLIERSGSLLLMSSMSGFRGHACAATCEHQRLKRALHPKALPLMLPTGVLPPPHLSSTSGVANQMRRVRHSQPHWVKDSGLSWSRKA